jgi:hypothetical protein
MHLPETYPGHSLVQANPAFPVKPVVVYRDFQVPDVLRRIIAGSNKHHLVVIVETAPGNGHIIRSIFNIDQPVIEIGKITMIDPNICRIVYLDGIIVCCLPVKRNEGIPEMQVLNNDIADP